ncbi:M48 family metallopeptidase [Sediminitomix flava]|uniref:Zn-dependent protease with chaperone function n=1 Tax=Sediminitomix flava TaxID=379075 RepID=A0A315ZIS9_SEDFL|nr:M48 family metallopeptidase [Sediminitomix flava]PWJ45000.1 Zn-dependent protease with chaperone function [Sediminitomix flava]
MQSEKTFQTDYRKWITFNKVLGEYKHLFDLYNVLEQLSSKGLYQLTKTEEEGETKYLIEQEGFEEALLIQSETERKLCLEYLKEHYLPKENIEGWYQEKVETEDRSQNLSYQEHDPTFVPKRDIESVKVHPKERRYLKIKTFISVLFYIVVAVGVVIAALENPNPVMIVANIIGVLLYIGIIAFAQRFLHGLFIGMMKGNAVRLNKSQYPEIYDIVEKQSEEIGLKEAPEVYVAYGPLNAFVTKFSRKKYLVLYSEVLETANAGNYDIMKFVIGHELAHIKRNHLGKAWLFPSLFIPILSLAYSRACEYTCDRYGAHFSEQGAFEGILALTAGPHIYAKISLKSFIRDAASQGGFFVWFTEKFSTHPHLVNRVLALKSYTKMGL